MKFDKQNNVYTLIYIIVLVAIVGAALAFTSISLKSKQQENASADQMRQILASVNIFPESKKIISEYNLYIKESFVVNSEGKTIPGKDAFSINVEKEIKKPVGERELPVYVATLNNGEKKYVLPMYGAGLWGPIWGYISLDENGSTVYGAYFAHQGETPGLGAEIEKPAFSDQFKGKNLFKDNSFFPIKVLKRGMKPEGNEDFVDGVSGGTITSTGVSTMIDNCLSPYSKFLENLRNSKK